MVKEEGRPLGLMCNFVRFVLMSSFFFELQYVFCMFLLTSICTCPPPTPKNLVLTPPVLAFLNVSLLIKVGSPGPAQINNVSNFEAEVDVVSVL